MKKLSILNLYCGIGGNRRLWKNVEVTAIEDNPEIAKIYQDFFPNDKVIVCDAHKYLLEHFQEFDFIWSSPPCPTHSRINFSTRRKLDFPDIKLYEEIIFLRQWFKGKWVVENVIPYYKPLIKPQFAGRHCFWCNFILSKIKLQKEEIISEITTTSKVYGSDLNNYKIENKRQILRNQVNPKLALHIFNMSFKDKQEKLIV